MNVVPVWEVTTDILTKKTVLTSTWTAGSSGHCGDTTPAVWRHVLFFFSCFLVLESVTTVGVSSLCGILSLHNHNQTI